MCNRVQRTTNTTMSLSQNPVMGQMAKSFANVNTYVHRGQNVVSSKAFNRKDANTEAQKAQRASFKLIADVYNSLGGYGELGFPNRPEKLSAYNYFMQLNLPAAIDYSGDVPVVDYSLLQVAKGTLPQVLVRSATIAATGLTLDVDSNIDFPKALATDMVQVIAKTKAGAVYAVSKARGTNEALTITLAMPDLAKGDMEFVYVFVVSPDGKKASNSTLVVIND